MQRTFTTGDLIKVTGVLRNTLQSWMHRDDFLISSEEVDGGDGSGKHRRFSLPAVIHFAVGVELVRAGLPPATAFQSAAKFAYFGKPRFWYGSPPQTIPLYDERPSAMPFHHSVGQTLLIVPGGLSDRAEVLAVKEGKLPLWDVPVIDGASVAFVALDVGKVWHDTLTRLGMDPVAEMRAVYEQKAA